VSDEPDRQAIVEALLFVTEDPLPLPRLQEILADGDPAQTEQTIHDLALRLEGEARGLMVQEVAGGFRLATRPEVAPWVMKLQEVKPARLSRAALETLAIIAYRQPITRPEIEAIRGVSVDGVMKTLLERELIRMMGRKADAGRPMLYGTTQLFLEHFGLKDLGDLPTLKEINELITASGETAGSPAESEGGAGVDTGDAPAATVLPPVPADREAGGPSAAELAEQPTESAGGESAGSGDAPAATVLSPVPADREAGGPSAAEVDSESAAARSDASA
jgi:segregation and condensation protein B